MEFFDKLSKKASEAYKITADKTGKIAKETKLKLKMSDLKGQIEDIYKEIGKKVYEKHIREEDICIKKELEEECTKIDVISEEIEGILKECMELKDKKQCSSCFKEIDKNMNFCPECGAKQEEEPAKGVEVLDNSEKAESESEEVKDNLSKTVEIESNVEETLDSENIDEE